MADTHKVARSLPGVGIIGALRLAAAIGRPKSLRPGCEPPELQKGCNLVHKSYGSTRMYVEHWPNAAGRALGRRFGMDRDRRPHASSDSSPKH